MTSIRPDFLALAHERGIGIARSALWSGSECTWEIIVSDRRERASRKPSAEIADGLLYQGSSGIGLFLAELWALTGDREVLTAARGAAVHCQRMLKAMDGSKLAFFTGRTGIAYFYSRLAELTESAQYAEWARDSVLPIIGSERRDRGYDVIAGSAGAIPVLLRIGSQLELPGLHESIVTMGEMLIEIAQRTPLGWWWRGNDRGCHRGGLAGLAHGAAGYAYGLLELFAATRDDRYRYAAEQAFLYESSVFQPEEGNWLDLRNRDLIHYQLIPDGPLLLRERLRSGPAFPPHDYRCMSAWCHGAPGIGLTRLRAFQLLKVDAYAEQARTAVQTTASTLAAQENCSLCHGLAGNCVTLLTASSVFDDASWTHIARDILTQKLELWRERSHRWPSGTTDALPDPSLLMGDAGMGYLLLQMSSPNVPSVLFLTASEAPYVAHQAPIRSNVQEEHINQYFGRTIRVLSQLNPSTPKFSIDSDPLRVRSDIQLAHDALLAQITATQDPIHRAFLEDAFAPERALYESALQSFDLSAETLHALRRPSASEVHWSSCSFERASTLTLIQCEYDWDAWLNTSNTAPSKPPQSGPTFIVYRDSQSFHLRRVSQLASLLLSTLHRPMTLAAMCDEISASLALSPLDTERLCVRIRDQLQSLYLTGLIDVADEPTRS